VAVFLAIGGLLSGLLWSSVFVANPAGMIQERRVSGGSGLIPQAEGAEIDSAALTPQSAPFLAFANVNAESIQSVENTNVLYGEGAFKDAEPIEKTKTTASAASVVSKAPTSDVIYQVAVGDTPQSISAIFGVPINTIVEFNPSVNFSSLSPGISIIIPSQKDVTLLSS
jgi:LysM repeat protein